MFSFDERTRALLDAVTRLGSVSAAARSMGLDASNAHRHLRAAEARAGTRLVERRQGSARSHITRAARSRIGAGSRGLTGRALAFDAAEGTTPVVISRRMLHVAGRLPEGAVTLHVRPEDVTLTRTAPATSARNALPGHVVTLHEEEREGTWRVDIACGGLRVTALITRGALRELRLRPGSRVVAVVKATALHPIARDLPVGAFEETQRSKKPRV